MLFVIHLTSLRIISATYEKELTDRQDIETLYFTATDQRNLLNPLFIAINNNIAVTAYDFIKYDGKKMSRQNRINRPYAKL